MRCVFSFIILFISLFSCLFRCPNVRDYYKKKKNFLRYKSIHESQKCFHALTVFPSFTAIHFYSTFTRNERVLACINFITTTIYKFKQKNVYEKPTKKKNFLYSILIGCVERLYGWTWSGGVESRGRHSLALLNCGPRRTGEAVFPVE